jgi:ectoine hydroxylase-related dioxygenase (phytanoyl-CoA dioxygenase family)
VVPCSHRWDSFHTVADPKSSVPAGSALLYSGKTIHGADANRTEQSWRRGLHMSFVLGWLTPEEASPIAVSWEIARATPREINGCSATSLLDIESNPRRGNG